VVGGRWGVAITAARRKAWGGQLTGDTVTTVCVRARSTTLQLVQGARQATLGAYCAVHGGEAADATTTPPPPPVKFLNETGTNGAWSDRRVVVSLGSASTGRTPARKHQRSCFLHGDALGPWISHSKEGRRGAGDGPQTSAASEVRCQVRVDGRSIRWTVRSHGCGGRTFPHRDPVLL